MTRIKMGILRNFVGENFWEKFGGTKFLEEIFWVKCFPPKAQLS